jgi:AcrR family transcriptional regulator
MRNRQALLEAGIACLRDRDSADIRARDIAGRANVSLGAIGYHFGTTDNLLHEALAEAVHRWLDPLVELISTAPVLLTRAQLGPAIDRLLETFKTNRPLVLAYFQALLRAQHAPDLRSAMAADFDALRAAITTGIERLQAKQPLSRRLDPEVSATLVMAVFDGLIMQGLLDPSRLPAGEEIAETLRRAALQHQTPANGRPRRSADTVGA